MNTGYPYTIEADEDGGFLVQFVDIENAFTEGDDLEEAKFNAEEVLTLVLSCILDDNEEIPEPSVCPKGGFIAYPASKIQTAILLRKARGSV
jgi:antitoxin HicB